MNRTPDDATRLMNLLVAICGDPSDFCPGWAVFHQFEITKNSEPSNSATSSSAAHTTEIESHRLSLLWIMNPAPQPAAAFTPETRFCP